MSDAAIQQVRRFNRLVTRRVGALDDSYLSRGRPLGEARLIFEIGLAGADARSLRAALGLDSGYLSRLLRALSAEGLIEVARGKGDARVKRVALTAKGRGELAAYERLSDELAGAILAPLAPPQRERLLAAMAEVERLMRAGAVVVGREPADAADAVWCLDACYRELARRFDAGFDPANGKPVGVEDMTPPRGWLFLARLDGRPVGCGALVRLSAKACEIKRMWTAPEARGLGVAKRLIAAIEAQAGEAGLTTLRLDTNRALKEAQALYRKLGFVEIARYNDNPYADHWFEKRL
jgi:DNA-binding MarR family transcriptional regulator/ribosomal protein S18 acetylase RimI-like enzyme